MKRRDKDSNAVRTLSSNPKKIFLFGNGINYSDQNRGRYGWKEILDSLNMKFAQNRIANIDKKPFPLVYDEIVNYSFKFTDNDEVKIKQHFQQDLKNLKPTSKYVHLRNLDYDEILTTNYDYNFEISLDPQWVRKRNFGHQEINYSCYRHQRLESGCRIWHIHGEKDARTSILLGFRHYLNYSARVKRQARDELFYLNPAKKKRQRSDPTRLSWIKYFFTDHINIIGLGFTYTEYPLFWLLAYRHYQKESGRDYIIENTIRYIIPSFSIDKKKDILDTLISYGVEIRSIHVPKNDYDQFYKKIGLNEIGEIYNPIPA